MPAIETTVHHRPHADRADPSPRRSRRAALLAALALLPLTGAMLAGCASPEATDAGAGSGGSGTAADAQPPLSGSWTLVGGEDADGAFTVEPAQLTLDLQQEGAVTGSGGCNTFSGDVTDDPEAGDATSAPLEFGPLLRTMMACADDADTAMESRYLAALEQATAYAQGDGRLVITGDGVELDFDELSTEDE
jgi:heat shock protein HslJ